MADPGASIRVLVADDHPVVRQGLRAFLATRSGITVVAEAGDAGDVVRKARAADPDVVVLDLVMPGGGGVAAIRGLVAAGVRARVLVLTSFAAEDQVVEAVRAGAVGYLLKHAQPAEVERAVRATARGEAVLDPSVAPAVLDAVAGRRPPAPHDALTARERDVLVEIARGRSNREIGRALGIGEKTVKTHVSNVLRKLGVIDRTQAALYAVRAGLIDERR